MVNRYSQAQRYIEQVEGLIKNLYEINYPAYMKSMVNSFVFGVYCSIKRMHET